MYLRSYVTPTRFSFARYQGDPLTSLQHTLQRTMDDLLTEHGSQASQTAAMSVRLDVKEDEGAFHVTAELPGLNEKEVEVTFDDGLLTIRGEKKVEREDKKDTWHIIERSSGSFARQLTLPASVNGEKIEAKFEKGVLKVTLPKIPHEQAAAKKITITAG